MADKGVKEIIIDLEQATERGAQALVMDIHSKLVPGTPKDTGWAQSNWIGSVGNPVSKPIGSKQRIDNSAQVAGLKELSTWKFVQGPAYITNNVPYIQKLNSGWSGQAPAGFIEAVVQDAVDTANRRPLK